MPSALPGHGGDVVVHGVADVADELPGGQGGDAVPHGRLGDLGEPLVLGIGGAHDHGPGRVGVPAVHDRAAVDREDVPVLQDAAAGDAVHHLLVDRGADGGGEAVVAEEIGRGAGVLEHRGEHGVEVLGGLPRRGGRNGGVQGAAQDKPGLVHGAHLGVGLVFDAWLAECHPQLPFDGAVPPLGRTAKWLRPLPVFREEPQGSRADQADWASLMACMTRSVTSSMPPMPSTRVRMPRSAYLATTASVWLVVQVQAVPDDGFVVVGASGFLGAAQQAGDQFLVVGRELQDDVELLVAVGEDPVEVVHLRGGARVAVQQEAVLDVVLAEAVADHLVGHAVRDEVAGVHVLLGFDAKRRLTLDVGAEDVAGGDRNDAEALGNAFRLRSLAGTGRSDNQHSRHRKSPS